MNYKYIKNIKIWYVLILFLLYMLICFIMPTLINGDIKGIAITKKEENVKKGDTIKLLLTESNTVVDIDFEDYIKGVLIGEMPVTYELEALKAQAVVARTYTLYKINNAKEKHEYGADMCDNINCCQAYKTKEYALESWDDAEENDKWAKLEGAVNSTSGEVILYNGQLINAFFHANSGGKTENVKYLWSKEEIPYLVSVEGNESNLFQDSKTISKEEFKTIISSKVPNYNNESRIIIEDYTGSGRVNNVNINGTIIDAPTLRSLTGIRSTNFRVEDSGDTVTFYTIGYGHGIGLSQDGANQMAANGNNYIEIIKHYYTGVEVSHI